MRLSQCGKACGGGDEPPCVASAGTVLAFHILRLRNRKQGGDHDHARGTGRRSRHSTDPRCGPGFHRAAADVDLGRGEHRAGELGARCTRHRAQARVVGDHRGHRAGQPGRLRHLRRLHGDGPQDRGQPDGAQPLRLRPARRLSAERADVPDDAVLDRREHLFPGQDRHGHSRPVRYRRHLAHHLHCHHIDHGRAGRHRRLRLLRHPHLREIHRAGNGGDHGADERPGLEPARPR